MLTRVGTDDAFVSVNVAGAANVSRWTVTVKHPRDGVGVTVGTLSAGVTDTGIISVAEQTCLSVGTEADKRSNAVDASGAWTACGCRTVVDVL